MDATIRELVRDGDPVRALGELARIRGRAPIGAEVAVVLGRGELSDEALRAADELTRGGVDPDAPWPCARGDAWRTGRSRVVGPTRGEVVERRSLRVALEPGVDFAVDVRGRILAALAGSKQCAWIEDRSTPRIPGGEPLLLAQGAAAIERTSRAYRSSVALHLQHPRGLVSSPGASVAFGPGHAIVLDADDRIRAVEIATGRDRWVRPAPVGGSLVGTPCQVARAPGAVFAELAGFALPPAGNHWEPASFQRVDLVTGADQWTFGGGEYEPEASFELAAPDGRTFFSIGDEVWALGPDRKNLWNAPCPKPRALAGPDDRLLLVGSNHAVDAATGERAWSLRGPDLEATKVDARGFVYARRATELVSMDPRRGRTVWKLGLRTRRWSFAFAPGGRIFVLRAVRNRTELIAVE